MKPLKSFLAIAAIAAFGISGFADAKQRYEEHKAPPKAPQASTKTQHFTVTVHDGKYSPSTLNVKAGRPVHLMFKLGPNVGCGNVLVIKGYKVRKQLAKGKTTAVTFTPTKRGKYPFTCGMGMYRGTIVVS